MTIYQEFFSSLLVMADHAMVDQDGAPRTQPAVRPAVDDQLFAPDHNDRVAARGEAIDAIRLRFGRVDAGLVTVRHHHAMAADIGFHAAQQQIVGRAAGTEQQASCRDKNGSHAIIV